MPNLEKLSLSYNNIVSLKPMRRIHLPKIIQIQFDHNLFEDVFWMNFLQLNKKMKTKYSLWLYFSENSIEKQQKVSQVNSKIRPHQI